MKNMRRCIMFFALIAMVMPCMAQQLNYSVSGTYAEEGKKVYLIDNLKEIAIDSVVVANGNDENVIRFLTLLAEDNLTAPENLPSEVTIGDIMP